MADDENAALEYLKHVAANPEQREALKNATAKAIVDAGAAAGFNFTEDDVHRLQPEDMAPGQVWYPK